MFSLHAVIPFLPQYVRFCSIRIGIETEIRENGGANYRNHLEHGNLDEAAVIFLPLLRQLKSGFVGGELQFYTSICTQNVPWDFNRLPWDFQDGTDLAKYLRDELLPIVDRCKRYIIGIKILEPSGKYPKDSASYEEKSDEIDCEGRISIQRLLQSLLQLPVFWHCGNVKINIHAESDGYHQRLLLPIETVTNWLCSITSARKERKLELHFRKLVPKMQETLFREKGIDQIENFQSFMEEIKRVNFKDLLVNFKFE